MGDLTAYDTEPILVERLSARQAVRLLCDVCGHERDCNVPDELNQEATFDCPSCGGWSMHFKYEEADPCKGCGKLGFWEAALDHCCSRVCQLQAEYKRSLEAA